MDPNELVKHIPEIATAVTAASAALPFTSVVKRMLGPAADEVGELLRDSVRLYRYKNQIRCLEKAEKMAQEAGFTPQAVPPKILFPLLEGASFEDNEELHTMWAALLVNAASPTGAEKVRPIFMTILRILAPDDARLLRLCYEDENHVLWKVKAPTYKELFFEYAKANEMCRDAVNQTELSICLDTLEANRLIVLESDIGGYYKTTLGEEFIRACSAPRPSD